MGVEDGTRALQSSTKKRDLWETRHSWPGGGNPVVGIDVSVLMMASLGSNKSLEGWFMAPPVPVTPVAKYVQDYCQLLKAYKFDPVLVFDGARNPLKSATTSKRYQNLPADRGKLEAMYSDPATTMPQIVKQQRESISIREDTQAEVLSMAPREEIPVVGSPFGADSQLIALMVQGVIDYVLTVDSDLPSQGAFRTICKLSRANRTV